MNLIIVESPHKALTIKNMLGDNYDVIATNGHFRIMPENRFGIKINDNYKPTYVIDKKKKPILQQIKDAIRTSDDYYIATDPDREGESIAWHLCQALKLDINSAKRIIFNEITKTAILKALKNPNKININLVNAQQARAILDRIIGFSLSPIVNAVFKKTSLSVGRVQSVALKLIVDKQKDIDDFKQDIYYDIHAICAINNNKFKIKLYKIQNKNINIVSEIEANNIKDILHNKKIVVKNIQQGKNIVTTHPPFTTSTLQQECIKHFKMSATKIMSIAQRLYEGIDINGQIKALVTYIRTDSTRISNEALKKVRQYIKTNFGDNYLSKNTLKHKTKNKIQDAHEAIRPIDLKITPDDIKPYVKLEEYKIYNIIYNRFIASQMSDSVINTNNIEFVCKVDDVAYQFNLCEKQLDFDGWSKVYNFSNNFFLSDKNIINLFKINHQISISKIDITQKFTEPPKQYTESTLIKTLETNGIGRPSTYANITNILLSKTRGYTTKKQSYLIPTQCGNQIVSYLMQYYSSIINIKFTALFEEFLDKIVSNEIEWIDVVDKFYKELKLCIDNAKNTNILCECGGSIVSTFFKGRMFYGCSNYQTCLYNIKHINFERIYNIYKDKINNNVCQQCGNNIQWIYVEPYFLYYMCKQCNNIYRLFIINNKLIKCEQCYSFLTLINDNNNMYYNCIENEKCDNIKYEYTKQDNKEQLCKLCDNILIPHSYNTNYYNMCSQYPICTYKETIQQEEYEQQTNLNTYKKCEKCNNNMILRHGKYSNFYGCSQYPKCDYIEKINNNECCDQNNNDVNKKCEKCNSSMILRHSKYGNFYGCSQYPKCDYVEKCK